MPVCKGRVMEAYIRDIVFQLDLHFDDGEASQELALRLGAIRLPKGGSCPVYAGPAAHPFCLCSAGQ